MDDKTPHPVDMHVGNRIRIRRRTLGISQTALAEVLGITFQQIQKYERGANRVSASKLFEISGKLGVEIGYFFEGLERADDGQLLAIDDDITSLMTMMSARHGAELAKLFVLLTPQMREGILNTAEAMVSLAKIARDAPAGPAELAA